MKDPINRLVVLLVLFTVKQKLGKLSRVGPHCRSVSAQHPNSFRGSQISDPGLCLTCNELSLADTSSFATLVILWILHLAVVTATAIHFSHCFDEPKISIHLADFVCHKTNTFLSSTRLSIGENKTKQNKRTKNNNIQHRAPGQQIPILTSVRWTD